jgi:ribosome-associated translation inhibitor RaiA
MQAWLQPDWKNNNSWTITWLVHAKKETEIMTLITWNVVNINFHAAPSLLQHIRGKITALEIYFDDYPPDSVHLLVELARDLTTDVYTATLSLRTPKEVLRSQQSAKDPKQAFDEALKSLAGQLKSKMPVASEEERKARFADQPLAEGTGPQTHEDLVREQQQQAAHA